jgi:drug/metabolite transporter (DMT)-like permease
MNSWSLALITLFTLVTTLSQVCLKHALSGIKLPFGFSTAGALTSLVAGSPLIWLAVTLQVIGLGLWMLIVSREKIAVAVAVSGAMFYLLMATLGWILFSERLSMLQGLGLALISTGVILVALPR